MNIKHGVYAVLGGTGTVGGKVVENLLRSAKEVRAIGRNADRLNLLISMGAKAYPARFDDVGDLTVAFSGVDAVFTMIPTDFTADQLLNFQEKVGLAVAQALVKARVTSVVNLSSMGAQHSDGTGPVRSLHEQEDRLNSISSLNIIHLRPSYFMENLFGSIELMKSQGVNASPLRPDLAIPMIAAQDISAKAADLMKDPSFQGKSVLELFGPKDLTLEEVTGVLGDAVGNRKLKYIQVSYDEVRRAMFQAGVKPKTAELMIEMQRGFNEGFFQPTQTRTDENTGRTTLEDFSKFFALVYQRITPMMKKAV